MFKNAKKIFRLARKFEIKLAGRAGDLVLDMGKALSILGLSTSELGTDLEEAKTKIKKAFRKKALELHPDRMSGDDGEDFKILNLANKYLLDNLDYLLLSLPTGSSYPSVTDYDYDDMYSPSHKDDKYIVRKTLYLPKNGRTYSSSKEEYVGEKKFKTIQETISFINSNLNDTRFTFLLGESKGNWFGHIRFDPTEDRWYYLPANFSTPDDNENNPYSNWEDVASEILKEETGSNAYTSGNMYDYAPYGQKKTRTLV